jgi:hypothetical protein
MEIHRAFLIPLICANVQIFFPTMGQDGLEGLLPDNFGDFFADQLFRPAAVFSHTLRSQTRNADRKCNEPAEMACCAK